MNTENHQTLPNGWVWKTVEEVGEARLGRQRSPKHHTGQHVRPYLRVANVFEDRIDVRDVGEMNFTPDEFSRYELLPRDILLNEGQSLELVGRPAMYRGEVPGACFQNTLIRFRALPCVLPEFALVVFRHYLHSQRFQRIARWTTNIAHLGGDRFAKLAFPVPPLAEQRRIVAAIEEHLSALDAAVVCLERARERIARYKASFLRQCIWPADETARARRLVPLRTLFDSIDQGWSPKCESIPAGGDEWGVIKTTAVQHMEYRDAEHKRLPQSFEPRPGIEIRVGDLLVTRKGPRARAGVACAVSQTRHKLMACDTVYRIRVNRERVTPHYLAIAMSETTILRAIDGAKAGISESGVSLTHERLGAVEVPLPSLEKQMLIEADCEQMLSATRRCESEIDMQLLRAIRLRRSILKSAFDGELVPQDASVSKSSALSERVLSHEADSSIPVNQPRVREATKSSRKRSNA